MPSPACSEPPVGLAAATAPLVGPDPGADPVPWTAVWTEDRAGDVLVWSGPADRAPRALVGRARPVPALRLSATLMDHHVHGGMGVDAATSTPDAVARWLRSQRAAGVGLTLASLPALGPGALAEALDRLRAPWQRGLLAGVHLEGPYLSPARAGAHAPEVLCPPASAAGRRIRAVIDAAPAGLIRTLTLAPELPGAVELAADLARAGTVVCLGHTDTGGAAVGAALDAVEAARSASAPTPVVTHLFNAMRPFHHRDPGPLPALLAAARQGRARVELIADGVHVADEVLAGLLADPGLAPRVMLVSDAVAATGAPPGTRHRLGAVRVRSAADAPRLDTGGSPALAGGAVGLPEAVGRLLAAGLPPDAVLRAAVHVPRSSLETEKHAVPEDDVLVWSAEGRVRVLTVPEGARRTG